MNNTFWFSFSITVLVMWRDRKVSSTAFLLINLAITDTLTLLGFWFIQKLLMIDHNFDVNIGEPLFKSLLATVTKYDFPVSERTLLYQTLFRCL